MYRNYNSKCSSSRKKWFQLKSIKLMFGQTFDRAMKIEGTMAWGRTVREMAFSVIEPKNKQFKDTNETYDIQGKNAVETFFCVFSLLKAKLQFSPSCYFLLRIQSTKEALSTSTDWIWWWISRFEWNAQVLWMDNVWVIAKHGCVPTFAFSQNIPGEQQQISTWPGIVRNENRKIAHKSSFLIKWEFENVGHICDSANFDQIYSVSKKSWPPSYLHKYQQYQTYFYIER
jgi:hypothetical protein